MGPAIYMRQDHDSLEVVFYCFCTRVSTCDGHTVHVHNAIHLHCSRAQFFFSLLIFLRVFFEKKLV